MENEVNLMLSKPESLTSRERSVLVSGGGKVAYALSLFVFLIGTVTGAMAQQTAPSPTPAPVEQTLKVPPVAPNYRGVQTQLLPELGRVGVDMEQQQPLALRDALKLALENNKDIEVARENVKIAEFDLLGAHGLYDPRFTSLSYYERINTPISSFLTSGANGSVTLTDLTGTMRLEGLAPKGGGNYRLDFS